MDQYNFLQDLLDTYTSMSALLQILWLIVPPTFLAVMFALFLRYRLKQKQLAENPTDLPFTHPYLMDDEDIDRVIAYRPPCEEAPILMAIMEKGAGKAS